MNLVWTCHKEQAIMWWAACFMLAGLPRMKPAFSESYTVIWKLCELWRFLKGKIWLLLRLFLHESFMLVRKRLQKAEWTRARSIENLITSSMIGVARKPSGWISVSLLSFHNPVHQALDLDTWKNTYQHLHTQVGNTCMSLRSWGCVHRETGRGKYIFISVY
jgi:hypothetical protein